MRRSARWVLAEADEGAISMLSTALELDPIVARLLVNRQIADVGEARRFLQPDFGSLLDPYLFGDMEAAVKRIVEAVRNGQLVAVYGDYDVDGVTSTAIMVSFLRRIGARVVSYIPDRIDEGYGLNSDAIRKLAEDGVDLVITVDCGISSRDVVRLGYEMGLEFIITDHHEPPEQLPEAEAVINPKVDGCGYPFHDLAGVGVALKLIQATVRAASRRNDISPYLRKYAGLAALGTIGDVVPLTGENRVIVTEGLRLLSSTDLPGVLALLQVSGVQQSRISPRDVAFALCPRINAAGRMGDSSSALDLLLSTDRTEALRLALRLDQLNRERQVIEQKIMAEVTEAFVGPEPVESRSALVAAGDGWHPGVVGIVAAKIAERYYRPTLVISTEGGVARGSARSIPGFDILSALVECQDLLQAFGGHEQAAGVSLSASDVEALATRLNDVVSGSLTEELLVPTITADCVIPVECVTPDLVKQLQRLEPFGTGNPTPVFIMKNLPLVEYRTVGASGKHLKLVVGDYSHPLEAIGFNKGSICRELGDLRVHQLDLACSIELNQWNGRERVQLNIVDMAPAEG